MMNDEMGNMIAQYLELLSKSAQDQRTKNAIDKTYDKIVVHFSKHEGILDTMLTCKIAIELRKLSDSLEGSPLSQKIIVKILYELLNYSLTQKYSREPNRSSNSYSSYNDNNYNYRNSNDAYSDFEQTSFNDVFEDDDDDDDDVLDDVKSYINKNKNKNKNTGGIDYSFGYNPLSKDSLLFRTNCDDEETRQRLAKIVNVITVAAIELVPFLIRTFIERKWEVNSGNR